MCVYKIFNAATLRGLRSIVTLDAKRLRLSLIDECDLNTNSDREPKTLFKIVIKSSKAAFERKRSLSLLDRKRYCKHKFLILTRVKLVKIQKYYR